MGGHLAGGDPGAVPGAPRAGPMAGELVTETLGYDGGRPVTVYVPPDPPEAVVFAGDGQGVSRWGGSLEAAGVLPAMIVGVHGPAEERRRLREYSPVFDAERFAAHERFFAGDVGRWARSRFGVALPPGVPRCSVPRRAESSRSPPGSGIRMPAVRSSPARRAGAASRLARWRAGCRARTSSPARWGRSSSATRPGGRPRCAMRVRMSCCASGSRRTGTRCGGQSSR
jgi:hypothetical protein